MHVRAMLLALLVVAIWGCNFVSIKIGVMEMPALALLAIRYGLTGLLFLPFMKWPGWRQAWIIMAAGFMMGFMHQGLLYIGLEIMPPGLMSLLLQSSVIFVTLIGWLFLKETIGWRTWAGIALGIAGIALLVGGPDIAAPWSGYGLALLSAVFAAVANILIKKVDKVNPFTYLVLMNFPIAFLIAFLSLGIEGLQWTLELPSLNWTSIAIVLFYQSVIVALSHVIWQRLMSAYPISEVIPWALLIPVFGVASSALILGEEITMMILLGGGLTVAGIGIITIRKIQKDPDGAAKLETGN